MSYVYILISVLGTVFAHVAIKWQMSQLGVLPIAPVEKILFLLRQFLNPWILAAGVCVFAASLAWMAAMTKIPLSVAYPYLSLSFVLILLCSYFFFQEPLTLYKFLGVLLIMLGIAVSNLN